MTEGLHAEALHPLLSMARSEADVNTRLAALDAAARFPLERDAWHEIAALNHEIVGSEPAGTPARREALQLAVRIPLMSLREHLRFLAEDESEPDRLVVADALDRAGDPSRIGALLERAKSDGGASFQALAAMPVERFVGVEDVPPLPVSPEPSATFWRAMVMARLGSFEALEAFLFGGAPEPDLFFGSPWTAFDAVAAVQPVPDAMRTYLLDALERAATAGLQHAEERRLRLIAWAATGTADAEGNPLAPADAPPPDSVPAPEPSGEPITALPPGFVDGVFDRSLPEGHFRVLNQLRAPELSNVILNVLDEGNRRAATAGPGFMPGNAIVEFVGRCPDQLDLPVGGLLSRQLQAPSTALDDGQMAWVLAHDVPDRLIREATVLIERLPDAEDRRRAIRIVGLAADEFAGRAGSPMRGAGGGGARRMGSEELINDLATAAMDGGEPPEPPPAEDRKVNAVIMHGGARRTTFVAGKENIVRCWIGLPEAGVASANESIPATDIPEGGLDLEVQLLWTELNGTSHSDSGRLLLPKERTARSGDCDLHITVPADERSVRADIMFRYRGRMFEYVRIDAAVLAEGEEAGPRDALRIMVQASQREVIEVSESVPVDATIVTGPGVTDAGAAVAVFGGQGASTQALHDADTGVTWLSKELFVTEQLVVRRRAQAGVTEDVLDPADASVRRLLNVMAMHGTGLYNALASGGEFQDPGARIQLLALNGVYVPLEFVYDRGFPAPTAEVCAASVKALAEGADSCPECTGPLTDDERREVPTICLYGFWSISKVIERVADGESTAGSGPRRDRQNLPPIDSVAFAASHNVPEGERADTGSLLKQRFGTALLPEDWDAWVAAIKQRPSLLVLLAHHGIANGLDYLEIGDAKLEERRGKLNRAQITSVYVNVDRREPGPIVLLLGCQTAAETSTGYIQLTRLFQRERASIVVGTLAEILGRHAGPLARELVSELAAVSDPDANFGTILLRVRRRMLARGFLLALCIFALGDAEWRLSPRA